MGSLLIGLLLVVILVVVVLKYKSTKASTIMTDAVTKVEGVLNKGVDSAKTAVDTLKSKGNSNDSTKGGPTSSGT